MIFAGCFAGGIDEFSRAVKYEYTGLKADNYIEKAMECVNEMKMIIEGRKNERIRNTNQQNGEKSSNARQHNS